MNAGASYVSAFNQFPTDGQTVRVFELKGSYTVCGEHACRIADQFCKGKERLNVVQGIQTVTLSRQQFEGVLKEYLVERAIFKIELYEEIGGDWILKKVGSPGYLGDFEEELAKNGHILDAPMVMSLVFGCLEGQRRVGVASLDNDRHEIRINAFADDDALRNVECLFLQQGIKECITPKVTLLQAAAAIATGFKGEGSVEVERLKSMAQNSHVMIREAPKKFFHNPTLLADLHKKCQGAQIGLNRGLLEDCLVRSALSGLLHHSKLSGNKYEIRSHKIESFMRLDRSAQMALNVFPQYSEEVPVHSLYGYLNHCKTPMGKRGLKIWLRQPLVDKDVIETRLDVVEAFVGDKGLSQDVPFMLRGTPDIPRFLRRLEVKKATLSDLYHLYIFARKLHPCAKRLSQYRGCQQSLFRQRYVEPLKKLVDDDHLKRFEMFWEVAIDSSKLPDMFLLAPRYDEKLTSISTQMQDVERAIDAAAKNICTDLNLKWEKTGKLTWYKKANNSQKRCMKMTGKEERALRRKLQSDYSVLEALKDGIKFTNRALNDAAEELAQLRLVYEELQRDLMVQVNEIAVTFLEVFEDAAALLMELDILCAFGVASVSASVPFTRPQLLKPDHGELYIKGGRHPLVESQDGSRFVKNDCVMRLGESWLQFITGPNMGGKSTFIRQVGVIVLMAQIGCYVPCDAAMIPLRDAIFARVGAGDCQQHGVSTFMAEMLDTTAIFHVAAVASRIDKNRCSGGTSTCDGLGLAWSISEHLMSWIGCPTLFATHFHELTEQQHKLGVKNLHVGAEVDRETGRLQLCYKVCEGVCDASFGINVARSAGFPDSVVQMAESRLKAMEGL